MTLYNLSNTTNETLNTTLNTTLHNITTNITPTLQELYTQAQTTIQQQKQIIGTSIIIGILLLLGIILLYIILNNTYKKRIQQQETTQTIENKIRNYITILENNTNKLQKKEIYIPTIRIGTLPEELQEKLLKKEGLFTPFTKEKENTIIEPVLLLIKNDGTIETKQNIKEGELPLTDTEGNTKWIHIAGKKRHKWHINNKKIETYIGYEDEAELYPHEPQHLARIFYLIVQALQLNKGNIEKGGFKIPKWLIWGAVIIAIGIFGYLTFIK